MPDNDKFDFSPEALSPADPDEVGDIGIEDAFYADLRKKAGEDIDLFAGIDDGFESEEESGDKEPFIKTVFEWLDSIVASVVLVVLLFTFVFRIVGIKGESMLTTLYEGDRVIVYSMGYTPENGDVVVISRNVSNIKENETEENEPIIKRVIATEGQTVSIDAQGYVVVDGMRLSESYTTGLIDSYHHGDVEFPVYVGEGQIFVMGDNRNNSLDSRYKEIGDNGLIDTRYVLGRAVLRIFPLSSFGKIR